MSKKSIVILLLLVLIAVIVYILIPSDTKRIKSLIKEGKEAAIKKDIEGVMGIVSFSYKDRYGFTYLYLKENLKGMFQRYDTFDIDIENLRVEVEDKRAEARFHLKAAGTRDGEREFILGTEEVHESVFLTLQKENLKWQVVETYLPTREGIIY